MNKRQEEKLFAAIRSAIATELKCNPDGDDVFRPEIFADYRDGIGMQQAAKILENDLQMEAFYNYIDDIYSDEAFEFKYELIQIVEGILQSSKDFRRGLTHDEHECIDEFIQDHVSYEYPFQHYLDQDFYVNIMMDTGDGLYDYTLNAHYPCWDGKKAGTALDKAASIVWLAKTQGYTKGQLRMALDEGDMSKPKGFLESMRVEMANMTCTMQVLTFLVRMNFKTAITLNTLIKSQERNGPSYDHRQFPDCGYIVLDKKTETGLFNPWMGAGSVFEIQLEKDVKVPIKYIRSALPDGGETGYSVGEVYGMCRSAWRDTVKEIHIPHNLKKEVA